jgi:RNA polymerase sigma factor (sigma-70 family)
VHERDGDDISEVPFRAVVERVTAGDAEAREELFARLGRETSERALLLALARRLIPRGDRVRDLVETRDLIQSALGSGWLNFSEFRGTTPGEFLNWIRVILRRKIARAIRTMRARGALEGLESRDRALADDRGEAALGRLIRDEARSRVRKAMDDLPAHERTVLDLRLQGFDGPAIAARLGLKPETVRKRESRALARLRRIVEPEGGGGP